MGLYPYRGFEYRIYLRPTILTNGAWEHLQELLKGTNIKYTLSVISNYLTIVDMKQCDERLVQSQYYLSQKDTFFSGIHKEYQAIKMDFPVIELQPTEEALANLTLEKIDSVHIDHYGWYDVSGFDTTY